MTSASNAYPGLLGRNVWEEQGGEWCCLGEIVGWEGDWIVFVNGAGRTDHRGRETPGVLFLHQSAPAPTRGIR